MNKSMLVGAVLGAVGVTAGGAVATYSLISGPEYAEVLAVQPIKEKTGGSTFKNPEGHSAWELIDEAGCRGLMIGGAQMSSLHCNFMINVGHASGYDLYYLGVTVRQRVFETAAQRVPLNQSECDDGCAKRLSDNNVTTLRSKSYLYCVSKNVDTALHGAACLLIKLKALSHLLLDYSENVAS